MTPIVGSLDWYGFLARPHLPAPSPDTISSLIHHPILITGAGGSIGSALALRLAANGAHIILLESSENSLYEFQRDFASLPQSQHLSFYLGSVADRSLLDEIFSIHHPRFVFHAAAFKHVPLIEEQPLAAIANNIFGTQSLVDAAFGGHARVILLSTDKAVAPASIMGATKRVAEYVVLIAGGTVLRLGNVLASRGSVTEVFARQIAAGIPLTVTDPAARRYFLTIGEAVDLLLSSSGESRGPALMAPQLPASHYIADLARFMTRSLAPTREATIEFTHLRAGDKECEELWSAGETPYPANANGLIPLDSPSIAPRQFQTLLGALSNAVQSRDLAAALTVLRVLVPDYTPSNAVLTQSSTAPSQVSNE
ncbi:MAG: polysaccharide biosynthesis protein [Terracidiphilus sp.]